MTSCTLFAINSPYFLICPKPLESTIAMNSFSFSIFLNDTYQINGNNCYILIKISFNSSQIECVKHTFVRNLLAFLWESHHLFKSLVHFSIGCFSYFFLLVYSSTRLHRCSTFVVHILQTSSPGVWLITS